MRRFLSSLAPVILLLLCHFTLRTHNIDVQQAHLDEGFHLSRALTVWNFDVNPGRFAHGKMLLYFWLGLFERQAEPTRCAVQSNTIPCAAIHVDPETQIPTPLFPAARLAMALFSVITASTIYLIGRWLFHPYVGLLALALYAILPFAFFYERLAFADPLAAGMMTLSIWRSMVFARHPTRTQAVIMGLVLSMAVMAKMTMGLIILLPLAAIVLERNRKITNASDAFEKPKRGFVAEQMSEAFSVTKRLVRRYAPHFILACVVGFAIWLPVLLPALAVHNTPDRFILVNDTNIARGEDFLFKPLDYFTRIMPALLDYWTEGLIYLCIVVFLFGLFWFPFKNHRWSSGFLYIVVAMILAVLPSALIARVQTTRYLMPSSVLLVLILSIVIVGLLMLPGRGKALWRALGVLGLGTILVWGFAHARDFASKILTDPHNYPFHAVNRTEFVVAFFLADPAVQQAAAKITELKPEAPLYATWNLCHMMYYYTDRTIHCLENDGPVAQLSAIVDALPENGYFDLTVTDYKPFWDKIDDATFEELAVFRRRIIDRPVYVVRIWRVGETPLVPGTAGG